jgi:hypothetical protein
VVVVATRPTHFRPRQEGNGQLALSLQRHRTDAQVEPDEEQGTGVVYVGQVRPQL